ncbi:hypothetical protein DICVIV_07136 [Dictyocaulus viviparus]|uniref:Uncharacterized protein n=1 Tax=Dictyocaulus viviparus TaxID=29172 RepID=A0A0D8XQL8_DICVI|nr:hypothetical protein DICVIV_07136 [Dictyocaulus viviparus]
MGGASSTSALVVNTSMSASCSPQMTAQHMSPLVSTPSSSTPSSFVQQSLKTSSPTVSSAKMQLKASTGGCVIKPEVSSNILPPLTSPVISNASGAIMSVASYQDSNVPAACTLPLPALQFLASSNVSSPPTYEPISPDDNAPKSPFARAEAPSSAPASSGGSRMFSALDFDFPLAVAPTAVIPASNPPLAPPLAELLRAAGSDPITTTMTFEPLSDDDN